LSNFNKFDFDEKILKTLQEIGYKTPTPIQELTIPKVLQGVDVIASAQTGTGKTAAFMLPILHLLSQPLYKGHIGPQVLILVPTRELAMQVADEAKKFSKYLSKIKTVCIYGGVPYPLQRKALASRYEILVATPGRLMDHMTQGRIDLSHVKLWVLDEADRMLDMGFFDAVEEISKAVPRSRQTLLFSATIDKKILPFSKKLQNNAHEVKAEFSQTAQNNIEQRLYYVDNIGHKMRILEHILENTEINQSIVFTSTIQQANQLAYHLQEKGYQSEALHGDMNQRQRSRTINRLRGGQIQFLIATDVASRGIDIASLSHIINFDLPFQAEDFIHRIGRTGRAGAKGMAITFTTYKEELKLSKIHKLIGKPIELHTIEGMGPKPKEANPSAPRRQRPNSRFNHSPSKKPRSENKWSSQRTNSNRPSTSFSKTANKARKPHAG
jgi:superfamily II DNA/RNA helicase